ncbi:MAG TPA: hypothetical protein VFS32_10690 [Candidatus Limnocylindrales bacterium]|nr:hypothetical protein [Candidatus Limnocylindrales bacterium]
MRTIAATFADPGAAELARQRLEREVNAENVEIAAAAVSERADGPIDLPRTIVAVQVDGDAPTAREVLMDAGGQLVADVEVDQPPG